jgi:large subunit ribosomal protein L13
LTAPVPKAKSLAPFEAGVPNTWPFALVKTQTESAKPSTAHAARKWWVVDAHGQPLGRLASRVAAVLRGKHKSFFSPHVDTGDFVIVVNAEGVRLTGRKPTDKYYYRHSGHPGSLRRESFSSLVQRRPDAPIRHAVKGMLPKNVLGRKLLSKLKVYAGGAHPHQAQKPEPFKF